MNTVFYCVLFVLFCYIYFILWFCLDFHYLRERYIERKGMKLDGYGNGEAPGGVRGGERI